MSKVWSVTSYFNPMYWQRRKANYHVFRERLNCPLVTVELASNGEFELSESDADILVRVRDNGPRSVLFQKERMLNIAFSHVPDEADKIAWLDCDTILRPDWAERTSELLDTYQLCQPFSQLFMLGKGEMPEDLPHSDTIPRQSAPYYFSLPKEQQSWQYVNGLAWAARRSVLKSGLYPHMVLGGGDSAVFAAAYGVADQACGRLSGAWRDDYLTWSKGFCLGRRKISYVEGDAFHLWHGERVNRAYETRYNGFREMPFDPSVDLVDGEWAPHRTDLQEYARRYFESRREDGE